MKRDERLRLVGVEARLALGLEREPRIGFDLGLDRVEARAVGEPEDQRREPDAPERLQHLLGVAPDLRVEAGAPRRRTRRPRSSRARRSAASRRCRRRGIRAAIGPAGDDLGGAGAEHPALRRAGPAGAARAPPRSRRGSTTFEGLPLSRLGRLMSTTGSFDTSLRAVRPDGDVGQALDDAGLHAGRCRSAPRSAPRAG